MKCSCGYVSEYFTKIEQGMIRSSKELKKAVGWIEYKLNQPDVFIDNEKVEKAVELIERYFSIKLFDWEKAVLGLMHAVRTDNTLVFTEFLIMMGRGNGKNGFISALAWYFSSKAYGVENYNVDIVANSEQQAQTSFNDVKEMLERTWSKSQKFFLKPTKELIKNRNTHAYIRYNTSNAKTKDGKRTACAIFDEIHEYTDDALIRVFRSGLGKLEHCRTIYITTNGYVRDGFLDDQLEQAHRVLDMEFKNSGLCPLIYKIDSDEEADDPENWVKANPSLPYLPNLRQVIEDNDYQRKFSNTVSLDFFTKRMNVPRTNMEIAVTSWDNVLRTNTDLPDLSGACCVVGIDFSKLNDWVGVTALFRDGDKRISKTHTFVCAQSPELWRIKAPYKEWEERGLLTIIDDAEINPRVIAEYISELQREHTILHVAADGYRFTIMKDALNEIGFSFENKNLTMIRPSNIYKVVPIIEHCFNNGLFVWGDNPVLRWCVGNTMLLRTGQKTGVDTGNYYYAKIEPKSRKTDAFMSLVAAMCVEDELGSGFNYELLPMLGFLG